MEVADDDDHDGNGVERQPSHCTADCVLLRLQEILVFFVTVVLRDVTRAHDIEVLRVGFEGHDASLFMLKH